MFHTKCSEYYSGKIPTNAKDQKQIFRIVKSLWHKDSDIPYPEADSNQSLAEQFSELFIGKIETIRAKFDEIDILPLEPEIPCEHTFSSFAPLSEEAVKKLIIKSPSKSSALDPIPTHLMEKCIEVLLPIVKELLTYP